MTLKKKLTQLIRDAYQEWFTSRLLPLQCGPGCASCCSVNVKISSIEGEMIYDFIVNKGQEEWFASRLSRPSATEKIHATTNDFAKSCLAGEEQEVDTPAKGQCPFLEDDSCTIYEARPFSCRCFVSTVMCEKSSTAEVPALVLSASTVVMQLLEHVGQREYWGNLQDVLLALADLPAHKLVRKHLTNPSMEMQARARLLSGQPIPGFLLEDKEYAEIAGLLETIFNATIDEKRVEDILNGKV